MMNSYQLAFLQYAYGEERVNVGVVVYFFDTGRIMCGMDVRKEIMKVMYPNVHLDTFEILLRGMERKGREIEEVPRMEMNDLLGRICPLDGPSFRWSEVYYGVCEEGEELTLSPFLSPKAGG